MAEPEENGVPGGRDALGRVLGRGSVYTLATVIQLGAGILTIPILTRIVTPDEYGTITAALVVQAILGTVATFGSPAAISRTYFREPGPAGARALIGAVAGVALALTLLAELTGPLWSGIFEGLSYDAVLRLAVISALPTAILIAAQTALQAADRARQFVISVAIATAGAQGLGLILAGAGYGPTGYMAGVTAFLFLAAAYAWRSAGFDLEPLQRSAGRSTLISSALGVAAPTIPHTLALYMLSAADRVVIERLEGLADAGAYYIAYAIGSLGIFLVTALNGAWGPTLFGSHREARWGFLADSSIEITRVISLAIGSIAIGAPIALHLFAPSDYDVSGLGSVSALVALSGLPYLWYITSYNIVVWRARTVILAIATPLTAVVNVVLCVLLIPSLGLDGAALATLVGYLLLAVLTWSRSRKLADVPWDVRALLLASTPALAAYAVAAALPEDGLWLGLRGVLAGGLALLGLSRLLIQLRGGAPAAAAV